MTRGQLLQLKADLSRIPPLRRSLLESFPGIEHDPVLFSTEALGFRPWSEQAEYMRAVARSPRVAVKSGHKTGKSRGAAALALWWVSTRSKARVVLTAPSSHQVRDILWAELSSLYRSSRYPLGGELFRDHHTGLKFPDGREVFGLTSDKPERLSGISSPNLLVIVDEASGFEEDLFTPLLGNLAGGGKILLLSNPTRTSGQFYEAFHAQRAQWETRHISSLSSPNVTGEGDYPGLASPEWVSWAKEEWGEESPLYAVRVLGDFPGQADNVVIGLSLIEEARRRWPSTQPEGALEIGVDPARFGDDESVIFPRRGRRALAPVVFRGLDSIELAQRVLEAARSLRQPNERPKVKVDVIGVGAGVYDQLRRFPEVEDIAVNVAESATATPKPGEPSYSRLRDQLWFGLRDWLKEGGALPPDARVEAELVAPLYNFDAQGRIKVEAKDDLKKRLGRSPDRADALALAVYNPPFRGVHLTTHTGF